MLITNYRQQDIIQEETEIDYHDGDHSTVSELAQPHPWSSISMDRSNTQETTIFAETSEICLWRKFMSFYNLLILDNKRIINAR